MGERETWIDSIKGLSILAVMMPHCGLNNLPGKMGVLCSFGEYFIIPFFILSSYLSLLSYKKHDKPKTKWLLYRYFRLLPLFFIALVPAILYGGNSFWLGNENHVTFTNVITHLTFTHGFFPDYCNSIIGVEWYIGVLAIFYLIVPCLIKWINTFEKSLVVLLFSVFFLSFLITHLSSNCCSIVIYNYLQRFSIWSEIPILLMGVCFYYFKPFLNKHTNRKPRTLSLVLFLSTIVLLVGQAFSKNHLYRVADLYLCGFLFLVSICAFCTHPTKVLDNSFFRFFGRYSYPIYLFHLITLHYCGQWGDAFPVMVSPLFRYIIVLSLTTIVSVISVELFEKQMIVFFNKKVFGSIE